MQRGYIDCGTLYDGVASECLDDARIVIDEGRVSEVGPIEAVSRPDDGQEIDHTDAFVMPGLIDAHVHLYGSGGMDPFTQIAEYEREPLRTARATVDLTRLLEAGFTTVRDVSSKIGLGLRDAVEEGSIPGPRVYTSGLAFSQTGGHSDVHFLPHRWIADLDPLPVVDGEQACRQETRRRIRDGVDLIKIMATGGVLSQKDDPHHSHFTDAELSAFVEEAHRVGVPVAAHAQGAEGVIDALRNGVDTIEHGIYLNADAIERLRAQEAVLVPTLSVAHRISQHGEEHGIPPWGLRKMAAAREAHITSIKEAYAAGVTIAAGTDFMGPELLPHGENALELRLFVEELGMPPLEALHTATGAAAEAIPDDDVGTLERDHHADILVLSEDPRSDITALEDDIAAVYKGGARVA